jgi:hypothetical protein
MGRLHLRNLGALRVDRPLLLLHSLSSIAASAAFRLAW